jgi:hypothetical protein
LKNSDAMRRENESSCRRSLRGPSFETRAKRAPQDEVGMRGVNLNSHGEEAQSAVSNHEAPVVPTFAETTEDEAHLQDRVTNA